MDYFEQALCSKYTVNQTAVFALRSGEETDQWMPQKKYGIVVLIIEDLREFQPPVWIDTIEGAKVKFHRMEEDKMGRHQRRRVTHTEDA